jgi:hypothetical protein
VAQEGIVTIAQLIILRNADAGVTFYRGLDDKLKWEPPVTFTAAQLACLDKHKADLLALVDADEVLALLELPCAKLGEHDLGTVREGRTQNTTAAIATTAADRQLRLVRSE